MLSRPWTDILPVQPSRFVNKIYLKGRMQERPLDFLAIIKVLKNS